MGIGVSHISGSRLLRPGDAEPRPGSVVIEGDHIAAVEDEPRPTDDSRALDAGNLIVAPGIVDLGVFATDKPAFRFGGITRAALMPDQSPVHDDPATVRFAALQGKPDFWVHPLAAATQQLDGRELAEIALMKEAGAVGVSTGRSWIADSGVMARVMRYCAALDLPVICHAEDGGLTARAVVTAGETATRLGLSGAPSCAEELAIARDLILAEETGARIHFRTVSTRAGLDRIRSAKARGLPITCGITPAHLFLNELEISDFRTFAKLSPPLRSETERQACLEAIGDGTIDVICSGHDPRGPEDKRLPFADAVPGMAGAETLLALSLNLVRDGLIDMGRLFDLLSANPANILGVKAGRMAAGMEADLVLIDPDTPWRVDANRMAASAGNTPFDKLPVQGRVRHYMKGGRIIR